MSLSSVIVGIIGGTGIDQDTSLLQNRHQCEVNETPYGRSGDTHVLSGQIEGVTVYIMGRHGKNHDVNPSEVNYRANIWALVKQFNCTHLLVTSACGSLQTKYKPGDVGILDQYIDRTVSYRNRSFYKVCHIAQGKPINATMQSLIAEACKELGDIDYHEKLTTVTIEGPRFSTLAESRLHQSWGCDVVNMTSVPEVQLSGEIGVFYGCILLITDYDCWHSEEESVNAELVVERMKKLGATARRIIPKVIKKIAARDWSQESEVMRRQVKESIMVL